MIAELNGETRPIARHRRGVVWCPFCDRSRQDAGSDQRCDGCFAEFKDEVADPAPAAPQRRRQAISESTQDLLDKTLEKSTE